MNVNLKNAICNSVLSLRNSLKMQLLILFVLISLLGLVFFTGKLLIEKKEKFPFGESSGEIQITFKDHASTNTQRFLIKATENIEGEAVFASVPTKSMAQLLISSIIVGSKSSFGDRTAPYGGHISSQIVCNTQKYLKEQVILFRGSESKLILAVTNSRRMLGECSIDQVKFATAIWAVYDEQRKQILTIRLFKPILNLKNIEESQAEVLRIFLKIINRP